MSDREELNAWCIKESISKSTHDLYLIQRIWQAATASMQAKLDALEAEKQLYVADGLKATKEADAIEGKLDAAMAENERLWVMIKAAQDFSAESGLIGMIGSLAWKGQVRKVFAENARLKVALNSQWQPIETAPKDGKYYLFYRTSEIQSARWLGDTWGDDGWCYQLPENIKNGFTDSLPTHWMTLPEAPIARDALKGK